MSETTREVGTMGTKNDRGCVIIAQLSHKFRVILDLIGMDKTKDGLCEHSDLHNPFHF